MTLFSPNISQRSCLPSFMFFSLYFAPSRVQLFRNNHRQFTAIICKDVHSTSRYCCVLFCVVGSTSYFVRFGSGMRAFRQTNQRATFYFTRLTSERTIFLCLYFSWWCCLLHTFGFFSAQNATGGVGVRACAQGVCQPLESRQDLSRAHRSRF